jgi:hypothetical protein
LTSIVVVNSRGVTPGTVDAKTIHRLPLTTAAPETVVHARLSTGCPP